MSSKDGKVSAKEAANLAKMNPDLTLDDIQAMIPQYAHALPRRSWIRSFLDRIPIDQHLRFAGLK